jgi:phosphate butyryltransferase
MSLSLDLRASIKRICREDDLILFAHASGNTNPFTLPSTRGKEEEMLLRRHFGLVRSLSAVLGNLLPGGRHALSLAEP